MRSIRACEQVDRRRAEQLQVRRVDDALERRARRGRAARPARARPPTRATPAQARQLEEPEALREREILLEQPVALETIRSVTGSSASPSANPTGWIDRRRQQRASCATRPAGAHQHAESGAEAQLVQLVGHVVAAGEIEAQPIDRRLRTSARQSSKPDAETALDSLGDRQRRQRQIGRKREVARRHDLDRPQRDVLRVRNSHAVASSAPAHRLHRRAARHGCARRQRRDR